MSGHDSDEDAAAWVRRSRLLEERRLAEKRAREQEELERALQEAAAAEKKYTSRDLAGLKVDEAALNIEEGQSVELTLRDTGVLDEDGDELENFKLAQQLKMERAKQAASKKIGYRGYDDEFEGSAGVKKDLLAKYDEAPERKTTVLGPSEDDAAARRLQAVRERLRAKAAAATTQQQQQQQQAGPVAMSLDTPVAVASDTMTQAEAAAAFKRAKARAGKKKAIRRSAADELDAAFAPQTDELGARDEARAAQLAAASAAAAQERRENYERAVQAAQQATRLATRRDEPVLDGDDDEELLEALARQRQGALQARAQAARVRPEDRLAQALAEAQQHAAEHRPVERVGLVLTETTEFVRNLPQEAVSAAAAAAAHGAPDAVMADVQAEGAEQAEAAGAAMEAEAAASDAESDTDALSEAEMHRRIGEMLEAAGQHPARGGWVDVDPEAERRELEERRLREAAAAADAAAPEDASGDEAAPGGARPRHARASSAARSERSGASRGESEGRAGELGLLEDEEPLVARGLSATLAYINRRGGFKELESMAGRVTEVKATRRILADLAQDEARGGGAGGTRRVRIERDPADPIRIEYYDDFGRLMTPKEVFRMLSYKFHGLKMAKTKIDKNLRRWREQERQKAMQVGDTPLGTVTALERAQRKTGQAFVVLEGSAAKDAEIFAQTRAMNAKRPAAAPPPRPGGSAGGAAKRTK